jgi:hypothetical protein
MHLESIHYGKTGKTLAFTISSAMVPDFEKRVKPPDPAEQP